MLTCAVVTHVRKLTLFIAALIGNCVFYPEYVAICHCEKTILRKTECVRHQLTVGKFTFLFLRTRLQGRYCTSNR